MPKGWHPFKLNRELARKKAKAWRIKRKGLGLPKDKAALRKIAEEVTKCSDET